MNPPSSSAVEALYATGHWLLERERPGDAARVLRVMVHAAPTDERGWLALGACHEAIGQTEIAVELYRIAGSVAAPRVRVGIALGRALRALGRTDDARDVFAEARALAEDEDDAELAALAGAEGAAS